MPQYVQRARAIAEHLRVEENAFLRTAARLAESEGIFTWAGTSPGSTPSTRVIEFTVGDATLAFTADEAAGIIERLVVGAAVI